MTTYDAAARLRTMTIDAGKARDKAQNLLVADLGYGAVDAIMANATTLAQHEEEFNLLRATLDAVETEGTGAIARMIERITTRIMFNHYDKMFEAHPLKSAMVTAKMDGARCVYLLLSAIKAEINAFAALD